MSRLWIPGLLVMAFALLLIALFLPAPCLPEPTVYQRVIVFCEVYDRSMDCPAWTQGAMTTAGKLANECHAVYPAPKEVQFGICLEEYGF